LLSPDFFGNPAQNNYWGYDNYWEERGLHRIDSAIAGTLCDLESNPAQIYPGPDRPFLATTVIASLILAFGWFTPIYPFLYSTAPGSIFSRSARWLVVTLAALCALAGFGMQHVIDHGVSQEAAARLILFRPRAIPRRSGNEFRVEGARRHLWPGDAAFGRIAASIGLAVPIGTCGSRSGLLRWCSSLHST